MIWGGIQRSSTIDFPGVLSCVLFTQGCNLDCFYCHNRPLLTAATTASLSTQVVWDFLTKRQGLLDGIVISGGEPTLQPDLSEFIIQCRDMGYQIKLDTNGTRPEVIENLCQQQILNYIAVDVKTLAQAYDSICGKNCFSQVAQTIAILQRYTIPFEVRTTLYPGFTMKMLEMLLAQFPPMPFWRLNFFRMPESYAPTAISRLQQKTITQQEIAKNKDRLLQLQPYLHA